MFRRRASLAAVACLAASASGPTLRADAPASPRPTAADLLWIIAETDDATRQLAAGDALGRLPPAEFDPLIPLLAEYAFSSPFPTATHIALQRALFARCADPDAIPPALFGRLLGYVAPWASDTLLRMSPAVRNRLTADALRSAPAGQARLDLLKACVWNGLRDPAVVSALAAVAADPRDANRHGAVQCLGQFGPSAAAALPTLRTALADALPVDAEAADSAALAIWHVGGNLDDLLPALPQLAKHDPDARVIGGGPPMGGCLGEVARTAGRRHVAALTRMLDHDSAPVRAWAAVALGHLGPAAAAAVPALRERLRDRDDEVRVMAALALGEIGRPAAGSAADDLIDMALADRCDEVRFAAVRALGGIGGREAVSALRKLLTERRELPDREISACRTAHRRDAWFRWLLTEPPTGWPRAEVEAPLTLGIIAARSLGRLGPEADAAAERVAAMLSAYPPRREKHVRLAGESLLIAAMVGFREASLLPAWRMAKSPEVRVRRRGVEVLSGLAGEGIDDGAARALAFALLDPDPEVRSAAAEGIGRLGERVPRDLPWLWRRLGSPTIRRIGPPAAAAVLRLIKELASDDEATRRHAAWALSAIGPAAAAAAIDLVRVMDKDEHLAGNGALAAFAALGPAVGAEATTGLRCRVLAGADDADDLVSQRSAAVALLAVAPDDPAAPTARRIIRRALLRERSGIEWALSRLGTRGAEFAPDIAAGLRTAPTAAVFGFRESPLAQRCRALGAMGPDAASVLPELRRAVAALPPDLEPEHRRDAVLALWRIGRSAEECVPPLADLMARPQSIDVFHRSTNYADLVGLLQPVADALAETGHPAAAAALAERLSDRDPALRLLAARSLLRFAPSPEAAAAALPALLERLGDPDVRVRRAALSASMRLVGGPNCER